MRRTPRTAHNRTGQPDATSGSSFGTADTAT